MHMYYDCTQAAVPTLGYFVAGSCPPSISSSWDLTEQRPHCQPEILELNAVPYRASQHSCTALVDLLGS